MATQKYHMEIEGKFCHRSFEDKEIDVPVEYFIHLPHAAMGSAAERPALGGSLNSPCLIHKLAAVTRQGMGQSKALMKYFLK